MPETHRMSCGNCGGSTFHIEADNSEFPTVLLIRCLVCGSSTIYKPEEPRMKQHWGEFSDGVTCFLHKED